VPDIATTYEYVAGNTLDIRSSENDYWQPRLPVMPNHGTEQYWMVSALWHRINIPYRMIQHTNKKLLIAKLTRFVEQHLPCVRYICETPLDEWDFWEFAETYISLGNSHYEDDLGRVTTERIALPRKEPPFTVILRYIPEWPTELDDIAKHIRCGNLYVENAIGDWIPFPNATLETHSIYFACVHVLQQIMLCIRQHQDNVVLVDALWEYYCAFTDIFYFCCSRNRFDDRFLLTPIDINLDNAPREDEYLHAARSEHGTPWELYYPHDNRAFCEGDLPNLFHVLMQLPLWGEQNRPVHDIGRLLQKALPFASQRRRLIPITVRDVENSNALWRVLSPVFWVMMANLYSGDLGQRKDALDMRKLLRARQLTQNKQLFLEMIQKSHADNNGATEGAPLIMFTAISMHILYMLSLNPHYMAASAGTGVDWTEYTTDTKEMARQLRESNTFAADAFEEARQLLFRAHKNSKMIVARLRKRSCAVTLSDTFNSDLEKVYMEVVQRFQNDLSKLSREDVNLAQTWSGRRFQHLPPEQALERARELCSLAIDTIGIDVETSTKEAILALLFRVHPADRLAPITICTLELPEYGGISREAINTAVHMVHVYYNRAVLSEFSKTMSSLLPYDFKVICYYFNIVAMLERVNLVRLDANFVRRVDKAMRERRYLLFPGQPMPLYAYDVFVTACCDRIVTLQHQNMYGHEKIAYDVQQQCFVCAWNTTGTKDADGDENPLVDDTNLDVLQRVEFTKQKRKRNRNERRLFNKLPCSGQPVLRIPLRGFILVHGNIREKKQAYTFCPQCGAFHRYHLSNYANPVDPYNAYRCQECIQQDPMQGHYRTCAFCKRSLKTWQELDVMVDDGFIERMYFCNAHYTTAAPEADRLPQKELWKLLGKRQYTKSRPVE
jgi:transcription elongation factor Elf1